MNETEQKILDACYEAKSKGIALVAGTWGDGVIYGCALTCLLITNGVPIPEDPYAPEMAVLLSPIIGATNEDWIHQFMLGFDGEEPNGDGETEAWQAGYRIRQKLIESGLLITEVPMS